MRRARRNKRRRGGQSTTNIPLVARRRMELTPGRVDTLDARKGVLVEKHLARDDEGAGGRHVDARPRRVLGRPKTDPQSATVGKVSVAIPASKRNKDPNKAAESPKIGDGGRGALLALGARSSGARPRAGRCLPDDDAPLPLTSTPLDARGPPVSEASPQPRPPLPPPAGHGKAQSSACSPPPRRVAGPAP